MIRFAMQANKLLTCLLLLAATGINGRTQTTDPPPGSATKQAQIARHSQLAQQFLAQHEPAKAIPELQAVVKLDPGSVEARANLGVLLFFQGQFAEAVTQLQAAINAKPDLTKIQALLGTAKRRTGDDAGGRADLEAVFPSIEDEKLRIDVGRELIESYAASDDLDKATVISAALLKLKPTDPDLLYISYRLHSQMAVQALLEMGLVAPDSAQIHQAMAHELQRDHDVPGTIANLRKALALNPALPGLHLELAEALHASDDARLRTEAVEQYKLAVQTAPSDPKAATRLGDIEVEQGDLAAAAHLYRQALKLQPSSTDASIGLANVLFQAGDAEGAAKLLEQVEASDPSNSLAHFRLSVVYRKLQRPDDVTREVALYQQYKDEHEKLRAVYKNLRVTSPTDETPQ